MKYIIFKCSLNKYITPNYIACPYTRRDNARLCGVILIISNIWIIQVLLILEILISQSHTCRKMVGKAVTNKRRNTQVGISIAKTNHGPGAKNEPIPVETFLLLVFFSMLRAAATGIHILRRSH